jgi:protein-disulfide isomerase
MPYWWTMNTRDFARLPARAARCAIRHGLLAALVLLVGACSTSAQQTRQPSSGDIIATVGGVSITLEQIDEKALQEPAGSFGSLKLAQALYEARRAAAEEMIGNVLLDQEAKRRGIERTALVEQEITSNAAPVTEADVAAWYGSNPQRVQGATLDQVRAPIKSMLTEERIQNARDAYVNTLKAKTAVRMMLEPPRSAVRAGTSPARGPANAPVELIEFADFQCPYCLAASPTVKRVLDTYGDRIRFVYRNFPLQSHPDARPAAEAAQCANEQGQFWAYHDRLFAQPGKLSNADLKKTAADLGLDAARFDACVDEHKYKPVVDADAQAGAEAGVSGTPAFFINGRLLSGAQPYDAFKRIIDEELELKKR